MRILCASRKQILFLLLGGILLLVVWLRKSKDVPSEPVASMPWSFKAPDVPVVLWWTNIMPDYRRMRTCGENLRMCLFTTDRKLLNDKQTKVITFYGSDLNKTDLPLPRAPHHLWALMHEESPKNVPYIGYEEFLHHFNLTSTFSRFSDMPLTTQYLKDLSSLRSRKYMRPIGEKSVFRKKEKLAPVVFVQSICDTMSGRDEYVKELMQHIDVDSYGKCLNNKKLPESLTIDYLNTIESDEFYKLLARYKFVLSYENAICNDYISEKFWRPLVLGSIPVYFGSPTIKDWAPTPKSVIYISDFDSPKALAAYLHQLDRNDTAYNEYLDHKYDQLQPITNKILTSYVEQNELGPNIFESFECFLCEAVHQQKLQAVASQRHYDCPRALVYPPGMEAVKSKSDEWLSTMRMGKCEAEVLDGLLRRNTNFTQGELWTLTEAAFREGKCTV